MQVLSSRSSFQFQLRPAAAVTGQEVQTSVEKLNVTQLSLHFLDS